MCPHKGKHQCCINFRAGKNHTRRGVALLYHEAISYVDAATVFDALPDEIRRTFLRRFDKWIDDLPGSPIQHHQYHGWEKTQYDGKYAEWSEPIRLGRLAWSLIHLLPVGRS